MAYRTILYDQLQKYQERISILASQIGAQFDDESVHELRTTVKKLRSIIRWLAKGKASLPASLKRLYRLSGEIRNTQVLLISLQNKGGASIQLQAWLLANLSSQEDQWLSAYHARLQLRVWKKVSAIRFDKMSKRRLDLFVLRKKKEIKKIFGNPRLTDEQLHSIRKILKDMENVMDWCSKIKLLDKGSVPLTSIKAIALQAGDFNDKRVALEILQVYQKKQEGSSDEELKLTIDAWKKEREKKRRKLIETLRNFVSGSTNPF